MHYQKHSEEAKKKMSIAHRRENLSEETLRKMSISSRNSRTPETLKKLSMSHLGNRHSEETKRKMSEAHKKRLQNKNNHSFYGKKLSETHCKHISESLMGRHPLHICSLETRRKMSQSHQGHPLSLETKKKMSETRRGEKGNNWQGGKTLLQTIIRHSFKNRQWRSDVFTRDDFTCQRCGRRGGSINAHHINSMAFIIEINDIRTSEEAANCEELWNINNGITLCARCHGIIERSK